MQQCKSIILCADDFGLHTSVSAGILQLAQAGRINAVSCMVNGEDFSRSAFTLRSLTDQIKVGLHFNLTEGILLSEPVRKCLRLPNLLLRSHLHTLSRDWIAREFNAQLDYYQQIMGALPDFVDGHQHVHQFPQIREVLLQICQRRFKGQSVFIRSTYPAITLAAYRFKAAVLAASGGKALQAQLQRAHIAHNPCFAGVYDFAPETDYRTLFRQWLQRIPSGGLIMCHPAESLVAGDAIGAGRLAEFRYFASEDFLADCLEYNISCSPFTVTLNKCKS